MSANANPARDAFAFSLRGAAAINSYAFVPAIADDAINNRLNREQDRKCEDASRIIVVIEDFLARYMAPGRRRAA